ncbi:interleukin 17-like protein isoform X1 [Octopus bimaculoides]|uniref:Interleukin 17-like protein n=1 Tax=Octopus bimaculoides TaxID=37653 RepID=A0A0L8HUA8_OCTBM|nr:interleukin 17-like protein isoform X1 [Octopus bimaculoides]|eukprot:XP_014769335.1 PREDICTED: interleukin 17-like protein isoform X1 [Octopus bimaculoides]
MFSSSKPVLIRYLNCFFSVIIFVSSSPHCEVPTNLEARYRIHYGLRNKFISTNKMPLLATIQLPLLDLDKTCPTSIGKSGHTSNRSTCPWYLKVIYDKNVYPPLRTEAVCRCKHCLGTDHNYHCAEVFTDVYVLNRTESCVDGLYVYEPSKIKVATACVCARKIDRTVT